MNGRNNEPQAIVTCTNCGAETPLSALSGGDICPECGEQIDPDAPTKIRREVVDRKGWGKLHGDDYEPMGGYHFSKDHISKPDRDLDAITSTLTSAESGDVLEVTIGGEEYHATVNLLVVGSDRDMGGFAYRINLVPKPRNDGWTRVYITGFGNADLDPWEVVSAPYDLGGDRTLDMRDFAANGWMIKAETTDGDPDRVDDVDESPVEDTTHLE